MIQEIDVPTLQEWLAQGKPVKVLDVRPARDRESWWIPGSEHVDAYDSLKTYDSLKSGAAGPLAEISLPDDQLHSYLAAHYGLRPEPFYLGIGYAFVVLALSAFLVRDTRGHAKLEAALHHSQKPASLPSILEVFARTSWRDKTLFSASQAGLVNNLNDGGDRLPTGDSVHGGSRRIGAPRHRDSNGVSRPSRRGRGWRSSCRSSLLSHWRYFFADMNTRAARNIRRPNVADP